MWLISLTLFACNRGIRIESRGVPTSNTPQPQSQAYEPNCIPLDAAKGEWTVFMGEALLLLREQSERCEASTTNWAYYSPCDAPGTFDWVMTNHCMPDSPE